MDARGARGLGCRLEADPRGSTTTGPQSERVFHHTVGAPGVDIDDSSKLVELETDRRVVLEVRFRPAGIGVVTLDLERKSEGRRTLVTMTEHPQSGAVRRWWSPALDALTMRGTRIRFAASRLVRASRRFDALRFGRTRRTSSGLLQSGAPGNRVAVVRNAADDVSDDEGISHGNRADGSDGAWPRPAL